MLSVVMFTAAQKQDDWGNNYILQVQREDAKITLIMTELTTQVLVQEKRS